MLAYTLNNPPTHPINNYTKRLHLHCQFIVFVRASQKAPLRIIALKKKKSRAKILKVCISSIPTRSPKYRQRALTLSQTFHR